MSAELLREAAALMRSRAEAATPGPWEVGDWWHIQGASHCRCDMGPLVWEGVRDINGRRLPAHVHRRDSPIGGDIMQADASDGDPASVTIGNDWGSATSNADAVHIAAADPLFVLAVAELLSRVADDYDIAKHGYWSAVAEKIARAYLGKP